MTDTDAVTDQILTAWSHLAADTSALDGAAWLHDDGGQDWAAAVLVERFRAGVGAEVVEILQRELPLPTAGLAVRDIITACHSEYTPIGVQVATAAAAGERFDVEAAIVEELPFLRERISLAVERAVRQG